MLGTHYTLDQTTTDILVCDIVYILVARRRKNSSHACVNPHYNLTLLIISCVKFLPVLYKQICGRTLVPDNTLDALALLL